MVRTRLVEEAIKGAYEVRKLCNIDNNVPLCVFDLCRILQLRIRFIDLRSFNGMYEKKTRTILIPAMRPWGRQVFTCGHEIGHSYFGHGSHIDSEEDIESGGDREEELVANLFSGHLIMPIQTITKVFKDRKIHPNTCSQHQLYNIACQLSVGYTTLVDHLAWSLEKIDLKRAKELKKFSPKSIRQDILKSDRFQHLVVVDDHWFNMPIDLQVDDVVLVHNKSIPEGKCVETIGTNHQGTLFKAITPGETQIKSTSGNWESLIRVSRKNFTGMYKYRYKEDPDYDANSNI